MLLVLFWIHVHFQHRRSAADVPDSASGELQGGRVVRRGVKVFAELRAAKIEARVGRMPARIAGTCILDCYTLCRRKCVDV